MSIIAYTGLPGSGKSYNAVNNVILPALRDGRRVVTNIPIKNHQLLADGLPEVSLFSIDDYGSGFISKVVKPYPGAVFVLDEVWRLWKAGQTQKNIPADQQEWLAEHRHITGEDGRTTEICLVTQNLGQIANSVRILIENQFFHKKLTKLGQNKKFVVHIYSGGDPKPKESEKSNQLYGQYSSKVWKYYETHTRKQSAGAGLEQAVDKRGSIWRSPKMILGGGFAFVALLGGPLLLFHTLSDLAGSTSGESVSVESSSGSGSVEIIRQVQRDRTSRDWRVVGLVQAGDYRAVLISDGGGNTRRVLNECNRALRTELIECSIDGDKVTAYSGAVPNRDFGGRVRDSGFEMLAGPLKD